MALPTINSVLTLDVVWNGMPFCYVASKSTINLNNLDAVWNGMPFWGLSPAAVVITTNNAIFFGTNF